MKHRGLIIFILLVLIFGTIWWCTSPMTEDSRQKAAENIIPGIHVTSVTINEISSDNVKMDTRILLDNPLLININTTEIRYKVLIDSVQVAENEFNEPIMIKSGDTSVVELPVVLQKDTLVSVLQYFKDKKIDSADYSIHVILEVDVPIAGEKEIELKFTKKLPALKLPEVKLADLDLNLLQLRKKGVDVLMSIHNPNLFDIHLLHSKFNFYIDDYFALRGVPDPEILLPAGKSAEIAINADLQESKIAKTAWELLTGKDAPFTVRFSGILRSKNKMLDESKLNLVINGHLDEIRELSKKQF